MSGVVKQKRPVYLNLFKIRLPVMGMVSLAHRASGILLFCAIPFAVYLLDHSVVSGAGFERVITILKQPLFLLLELVLLWSLAHHFYAGIRFLLIDADVGIGKQSARVGAWLVIVAEIVTVVLFAGLLLL